MNRWSTRIEALHRQVNRAILRDRYGIFSRAGVKVRRVRVFWDKGVPYRRGDR